MIKNRYVVSLCLSRLSGLTSSALIKNLSLALNEVNAKLFIYSSCTDLYNEDAQLTGDASVFDLIDFSITDALMIYYEKLKDPALIEKLVSKAKLHNVPVIMFGGNRTDCINVYFDYESGFREVVRHMVNFHGYRDVHFIAGTEGNEFSDRRIDTFREVLEENGIPFSRDMVSYGNFWSLPAQEAVLKLISENRLPRAVICANDAMAIGVSSILQKQGYKVPDDVAVSGFDGIEEIIFSNPRITSGECRFSDLSHKIASIVSDIVLGKTVENDNPIIPQLMKGASCGCEFSGTADIAERYNKITNNYYRFLGEDLVLSMLTARIQTAQSLDEAAAILRDGAKHFIYNTCCVLKNECIDKTVNPLTSESRNDFGETACILWDADHPEKPPQYNFRIKDIVPDLDVKMQTQYPITIAALHFMNIPLGYAAFHFYDFDSANLVKIPQIIGSLNNAIGGMRNMRYQKYLNECIEENYRTDSLTGLYNRRGFSVFYDRLLASLDKSEAVTFALIDLDGLKGINDHFGHDEGDNAIIIVAEAIKSIFPADAIRCRFGGDEMAAVTKLPLNPELIKKEFDDFFGNYNQKSGKLYNVSASIGIYRAEPGDRPDFEQLLRKTDKLMYEHKQSRRMTREHLSLKKD